MKELNLFGEMQEMPEESNKKTPTMKPILFNTEMVRAILDGGKTQTRRIVKDVASSWEFIDLGEGVSKLEYDKYDNEIVKDFPGLYATFRRLPYDFYSWRDALYQPGDILYVRETWAEEIFNRYGDYTNQTYVYRADGLEECYRWHPSIHMPKEAARIFLRVTDVKVERLQDITINGIEAEGISADYTEIALGNSDRVKFIKLWNSTVKKSDFDRYGWDANPWVWVIEFERISKEEAKK